MKNSPGVIFSALLMALLSIHCHKNGGSPPNNFSLFHKDITIHEQVGSSEPPQMCIGLFQLSSDPTKLVFAASRGIFEFYGGQGFRIVGLNKDSTATWIKSYALPSSYLVQYSTCATIDPQDNIWIGGHIFGNETSYGRPFLVKLDKTGNISWSKALFDSAHTSRGLAIKALHNGDIAYLTFDGYNFELYRLSNDGNVIWSKIVSSSVSLIFDPSTVVFQSTYYNSHMLAEASDGSIFFACNSNSPVKGIDCLFKFSGDGSFVFAKTYSWPVSGDAFPPQIQCTETDDIIYADQKNTGITGTMSYPYLFIASKEGDIKASKAYPLNQSFSWTRLNELNYFQHKIYLTTAGDYEFDHYIYDQSLNLLSSTKTLGTNGFSTDYGGMSLSDRGSSSLYHILNIAGLPGDGNGFQFFKTDAKGGSCHQYNIAPIALAMTDVSATVANVIPLITDGTKSFSATVQWTVMPVAITSSATACSQ